ncbi:hypothetical protein B0J17DRAFT_632669 [Rhizoctonia solani]|nr:hypothetical protein B0J17DRAFT_632669 [Rhizoctonia solani]
MLSLLRQGVVCLGRAGMRSRALGRGFRTRLFKSQTVYAKARRLQHSHKCGEGSQEEPFSTLQRASESPQLRLSNESLSVDNGWRVDLSPRKWWLITLRDASGSPREGEKTATEVYGLRRPGLQRGKYKASPASGGGEG